MNQKSSNPKHGSRTIALVLFILRLVRLLVSVVTLSVAAKYFGVGFERESWVLVLNLVTILQLAIWGPLNETIRAKFIFIRNEEGEDKALKKTASVFYFSIITMTIVVVVVALNTQAVAHFIAPNFKSNQLELVVFLLKYTLWSAILSQITQLLSSVLNTYDSFYIPEISGFLSALINLILVIILSQSIGIYAFVVANYVSALVLVIALVYQIKKLKIQFFKKVSPFKWSLISPFLLYALPFFLPYIAGQCSSLVEKTVGNLIGHNAVSIIDYSKRITDIVQSVLTGVLTTIMVPILSHHFSKNELKEVKLELLRFIHLILLGLAIIIPSLYFNAPIITALLYNKGSISPQELHNIATLIQLYAASLICIFAYIGIGLILLSIGKNKQYAFWGMLAQLLMIAINLLMYRHWGIYTFVWSLMIAHFISAFALFLYLPFSKRDIISRSFNYFLLIVLVFIAVFFIKNFNVVLLQDNFLMLGLNTMIICVCYVVLVWILRLPEFNYIRSKFFK